MVSPELHVSKITSPELPRSVSLIQQIKELPKGHNQSDECFRSASEIVCKHTAQSEKESARLKK
jgi:hypothetical protein